MKKGVKSIKNSESKGFVWYSLRISFYLMLLALVLNSFFPLVWLGIIFLVLLIFTIIISIVHLFKHKRKAFAITILVISALLLLFYIIGLSVKASG